MNLTTAIPVRFNQKTAERLKRVTDQSGIPLAQLVRLATEKYLKEIEASGAVTVRLDEGRIKDKE